VTQILLKQVKGQGRTGTLYTDKMHHISLLGGPINFIVGG